ncbi:MAG TPA: hypothetical protein VM618_10800, partial [Acidimicrobiia bacterium]|nr:hypothetical protein [Acidimicrobiia bacterium]
MSLFGSLYDDDQPVDAPSERAHDAAVGDVPVPVETPTPTEVPPQPAALDDGEFPNLHAFADAAFGVAGGALDASPVAWDVASARAELSSFMAPSVLAEASSRPAPLTAPAAAGEASAQPAAESAQPAAAKAPVEASALPDPVDLDPAPESDEPEPEAPETSIPALAEQALALNDDFLPSHRPRLDVSLGGDSPTWTLKNVAVVVLAALVGFGAYKIAFSSASGDDAPTVELHDVDQADPSAPDDVVPQTPGALKDAAADAGARLDLQRATVAAA